MEESNWKKTTTKNTTESSKIKWQATSMSAHGYMCVCVCVRNARETMKWCWCKWINAKYIYVPEKRPQQKSLHRKSICYLIATQCVITTHALFTFGLWYNIKAPANTETMPSHTPIYMYAWALSLFISKCTLISTHGIIYKFHKISSKQLANVAHFAFCFVRLSH